MTELFGLLDDTSGTFVLDDDAFLEAVIGTGTGTARAASRTAPTGPEGPACARGHSGALTCDQRARRQPRTSQPGWQQARAA